MLYNAYNCLPSLYDVHFVVELRRITRTVLCLCTMYVFIVKLLLLRIMRLHNLCCCIMLYNADNCLLSLYYVHFHCGVATYRAYRVLSSYDLHFIVKLLLLCIMQLHNLHHTKFVTDTATVIAASRHHRKTNLSSQRLRHR